MIKKLLLLLVIVLLSVLPASTGAEENTGIATLGQAVRSAWTSSPQTDGVSSRNAAALGIADLIIDLDFSREKYAYLQARQEKLGIKADKADMDFRMGKIDAKARDELKKEMAKNDFDLNYYKLQVENTGKNLQKLIGAPISENFDFEGAYLITDAGKLSLPSQTAQSKNAAALEKKLGEVMAAYSKLGDLVGVYIDAGEKLAGAEKDFKTGKADQMKVDTANADMEKARLDALEGKAAYSKLLYELDCSLQGYISRDVKKLPDPIFLTDDNASIK